MLALSVFRDAAGKLSLRKKLTILVSVGVLLPLLVLTYLQGVTIVEQLMKQRLEGIATQALNPIAGMHPWSAQQLQQHFANVKREHPEIEDMFVFGHSDDPPHAKSDVRFIYENALIAQNFIDNDRKYLLAGRYLFFPLKDPTNNEPLGFAGVLLKESFINDELIAGSINKALVRYHAHTDSPAVAITISDQQNRVLYSNPPTQTGYFLETNFDRPFSNWKAAIALKNTNLTASQENTIETKRFVNYSVAALDSLLYASPGGRHCPRLRKRRRLKPCGCADLCGLALRNAGARRAQIRIPYHPPRIATRDVGPGYSHERKRRGHCEWHRQLQRGLLLHLDADRPRRDRALLRGPLGAGTLEPALAPPVVVHILYVSPVISVFSHDRAKRQLR